ncbi:hypothetical protein PQ465_11090 [Sphingobacterium oryzagri]|uniref:Uncharacterized protein n=1 Tax=Sphingobacterium oryzagri TaxID=3025669 RepID=A0ABY7WF04_9SPHI|nr:hypothetical protein [Sphingobacterium sp. KACC 22765]WDF66850.1 hypothetical protein PQ465_11090 [Sphingobacterium sp. KACC 22765]
MFWSYFDDNHFLTPLCVKDNEEQGQYDNYHMKYVVSTGKCTEAEFYAHVREIAANHSEEQILCHKKKGVQNTDQ